MLRSSPAAGRRYRAAMPGIVSYGAYLPYWRLQRSAIGQTLGSGGGKGTRSVASYDEDSTSMGVEAGRIALAGAPAGYEPGLVAFATTAPAYADKTNATAIHAALGLARRRAGVRRRRRDPLRRRRGVDGPGRRRPRRAVRRAHRPSRLGRRGRRRRRRGRAGVRRPSGVIAEVVGAASVTEEFLDRWRAPGEPYAQVWEERFGEHAYVPLAERAVTAALKGSGLALDDVDHVIVTGAARRAP